MSRFAVEIRLNHPQEANKTDEVIGTLRIETREECKCRKLVLYCQRSKQEPEELDMKKAIEVMVTKWETWEAGEEYSYPFKFEVDESRTGIGEQEVPTIEWFFLPEIHIAGEFQPDTSVGWIQAKNNSEEAKSNLPILLDKKGDNSTPNEIQDSAGKAILEKENIDQAQDYVDLNSAELGDAIIDEIGDDVEEKTTPEEFPIRIYFDKSDRKYRIGEIISGKVIVRAFGEFEVDWLGLVYQWRTHGRAELEEGELNQITVSENEKWRVGQLYEYRFSFIIEDGPTTYRGHNQNLDWYIRPELKTEKDQADANYIADILKAAGTDFLLIPKKGSVKIDSEPASVDEQLLKLDWGSVPDSPAWFFLVSVVLVPISGIFIVAYLVIDGQISFGDGLPIGLTLSLISLLLLAWVFLYTTRYKLAELRTGTVDIQISSLDSSNGIRSKVQFKPRKDINIERLRMMLKVKEKVTRIEGTRTITNEYSRYSRSSSNSIKQDFVKGTTFYSELVISDIPDSVPTNKEWGSQSKGGKYEILWTVTITIVIGNWYNWERKIPIVVTR